jgi:murein DD-endopeptidase MepM/ murein hydrolase activator NlpD
MPRLCCKFLILYLFSFTCEMSLAQTQSVDNKNNRSVKLMQNDPVGTLFNDGPRVVYPTDFINDPIEKLFWDKGFNNQRESDILEIKGGVTNSIDVQNSNLSTFVPSKIQKKPEAVSEVSLPSKKSQDSHENNTTVKSFGASSENILNTPQATKNTKAKSDQNTSDKSSSKSDQNKELVKYRGIKQYSAQWPVQAKPINNFGALGAEGQPWRGLVFQVPINTNVRSIDGGKVIFADYFKNYGNLIIVSHGGKITSIYANNRELTKKEGDLVRRGDVIAFSGKAGFLEYPALYFEVRDDGRPINPVSLLETL